MYYVLTAFASFALGFLAGCCWSRWTDVDRWKPYILSAYKRGREAGLRKGGR